MRRIRGQVEAIERALEAKADCAQVMNLIAASRGEINGFLAEFVKDHIRTHLVAREPGAVEPDAAVQLIEIVDSYFK